MKKRIVKFLLAFSIVTSSSFNVLNVHAEELKEEKLIEMKSEISSLEKEFQSLKEEKDELKLELENNISNLEGVKSYLELEEKNIINGVSFDDAEELETFSLTEKETEGFYFFDSSDWEKHTKNIEQLDENIKDSLYKTDPLIIKEELESINVNLQKNISIKEEDIQTKENSLKEKRNEANAYEQRLIKQKENETKRNSLVEYSLQFIGNPYVWGGTSLTEGADCSGFVQSIYANFDYSLPRTTWDQINCGIEVNYNDALAGDLICYGDHIAIYIGNGRIIHASNSAPYPAGGIKITENAQYREILSVRRIIY